MVSLLVGAQSDYIVKKNGLTIYGKIVLNFKKVRFGNKKYRAKDGVTMSLVPGGASAWNFATETTYQKIRWLFKDNEPILKELDKMPKHKKSFLDLIGRYNDSFKDDSVNK